MSLRMTDVLTPAQRAPAGSTTVCSTCGKFKQSGKVSCCARGGSWYGKCGSGSVSGVHHTWTDGIQVCSDVEPEAMNLNLPRPQNVNDSVWNVTGLQSIAKDVTDSQGITHSKEIRQEPTVGRSTDNERDFGEDCSARHVTHREVFFCVSFSLIIYYVLI